MSDATTPTAADAADVPLIDDDSTYVDESELVKLAKAFVKVVQEVIPLDAKMTELYAKAALLKAQTKAQVIVSDGMPDWTGATAAYRIAVADLMDNAAFKGCSAARLETIKNNIKSHTRRGVLDGVIIEWVRGNIAGLDKIEAGKEKDSPEFRKAMRAQYQRAHDLKLANPIACPDHWKDVQPSDVSVDAETEDTTASALNKAVAAVSGEDGMSVAEKLRAAHRLITAALTPAVQPNAKVPGGRDAAAIASRDLAMQLTAATQILSNKVTGEALTDAQATFAKYSYSEDS